jgi:hypothetical protein
MKVLIGSVVTSILVILFSGGSARADWYSDFCQNTWIPGYCKLPAAPSPPAKRNNKCVDSGKRGATARCLVPKQTKEYYVDQANRYFDSLDVSKTSYNAPNYHTRAVRWEWRPWLLLTGYYKYWMDWTASALRIADPSTVPTRICLAFPAQPFARCYVAMRYPNHQNNRPCHIYEEFTFNDEGKVTFVEAWSAVPNSRLPSDYKTDPWARSANARRLSTIMPGLGHKDGLVNLISNEMTNAARDPLVDDFRKRATNWESSEALEYIHRTDDVFVQGCGWNLPTAPRLAPLEQ